MSIVELDRTVVPRQEADLAAVLAVLQADTGATKLVGPTGDEVVLPGDLFEALQDIAQALAAGHAVSIVSRHERLTTQQAAGLLGVSRPTLVKLLEDGEIPFEKPGRHRRVLLKEVLDYQRRRSMSRREALDRMVEIADEAGMYEATVDPKRTR